MKNKYKLILSFFVVCVLLLAAPVLKGADIDLGGLKFEAVAAYASGDYTYTVANGEATIGGYKGNGGDVVIPSELGGYPVTNIGYRAFSNFESLTSITIPDSVISIGDYAFTGCENLTYVTIGANVNSIGTGAFTGCTGITKTNYMGTIDSWAEISFDGWSSNPIQYSKNLYINDKIIKKAYLSSSIINEDAFAYCESLESIIISDSVTAICDNSFERCINLSDVTIPGSVKTIGYYAFSGCTGLEKVVIENGVEKINYGAFSGDKKLTKIEIPKSITKIDAAAFGSCDNLKIIDISDVASWCSITFTSESSNPLYNGGSLYLNNSKINNLLIPDTVEAISNYAFYNSAFETVTISNSVNSIANDSFKYCSAVFECYSNSFAENYLKQKGFIYGTLDGTDEENIISDDLGRLHWEIDKRTVTLKIECDGTIPTFSETNNPPWAQYKDYIINVEFSENCTGVRDYAFYNCNKIRHINLPENFKMLGTYSFANCSKLEEIVLPNEITNIPQNAFSGCTLLKSVVLGDDVKSIGAYAFYECRNLSDIIWNDKITSIGNYSFSGCYALTELILPDSIKNIGTSAFFHCQSLETIKLPSYLTGNLVDTFNTCYKVKNVIVRDIETWLSYNFNSQTANPLYSGGNLIIDGKIVTDIRIPKGINTVNKYAFYGFSELKTVEIPYYVTSIGNYSFKPCSGLQKITIYNPDCQMSTYGGIISPYATIYGFSNSTAEKYANSNSIDFVAIDDIHLCENEIISIVKPTCIGIGYTEYMCVLCGKTSIDDYTELAKHETVEYEGKNPTCSEAGWKPYEACINCSYSTFSEIPALGHSYIEHSGKLPTCTDIGWENYQTCERCEYTTYNEKAALGHKIVNHIAKAPTCTDYGWNSYQTCSRCSYTTYSEIAALGHSYSSEWTIDREATCTDAGLKSRHCVRCSSVADITEILTVSHTYDSGKIIKSATCKEEGAKSYSCTVCGAVKTETIAKLTKHTYKDTVTKATVNKNGKVESKCKVCGKVNKTTVIYSPKTVELAKASFTYTGKALKPTVVVKDSKGNVIAASNYTVTYKNNKNVGTATVTVTFKGNYSGTLIATFKIVPKGTAVSKLEAKAKGFKATWKKQTKQVTGYEIQYSTSKNFTQKTTKTVKVKNAKTVTSTVLKLKAGTKYYVRIRTYKTVGKTDYYSEWSKVKSIKTKK